MSPVSPAPARAKASAAGRAAGAFYMAFDIPACDFLRLFDDLIARDAACAQNIFFDMKMASSNRRGSGALMTITRRVTPLTIFFTPKAICFQFNPFENEIYVLRPGQIF